MADSVFSPAAIAAWNLAWEEEIRRVEAAGVHLLQSLAHQVIVGVVKKTPVRTGELLGGFYYTIGAPSDAHEGILDPDGPATVARAMQVAKQAALGDMLYLNNGAPHFDYIENGTETIAPFYMVAQTFDDLGGF